MTDRTTTTTTPSAAHGSGLYSAWADASEQRRARLRVLWHMSPAQRVAAMHRGDLTLEQLAAWAGARPHEVPLLDGEFWFIAIREER